MMLMSLLDAKEFGVYPPREMLVKLAGMSKAEREEDTLFGLYLWETSKAKGREGYKASVMV